MLPRAYTFTGRQVTRCGQQAVRPVAAETIGLLTSSKPCVWCTARADAGQVCLFSIPTAQQLVLGTSLDTCCPACVLCMCMCIACPCPWPHPSAASSSVNMVGHLHPSCAGSGLGCLVPWTPLACCICYISYACRRCCVITNKRVDHFD